MMVIKCNQPFLVMSLKRGTSIALPCFACEQCMKGLGRFVLFTWNLTTKKAMAGIHSFVAVCFGNYFEVESQSPGTQVNSCTYMILHVATTCTSRAKRDVSQTA